MCRQIGNKTKDHVVEPKFLFAIWGEINLKKQATQSGAKVRCNRMLY